MRIGIIVNPESGKDIRRIISDAFTFNNFEKLNVVKRIVNSALSISKPKFIFMPDSFGFGKYLKKEFPDSVNVLDFVPEGENDTAKAANLMVNLDVCCIVILGGDGTNRLAAKNSQQTPLIPISTGTNNTFPYFYDGTIVGSAIGAIAIKEEIAKKSMVQQKRIEILRNEKLYDIALVDVAVIENDFIGSKAVYNSEKIKKIFVSFGEPKSIGLSSIFGFYLPIGRKENAGGFCKLGKNNSSVLAPIMPGKLSKVNIEKIKKVKINEEILIEDKNAILSLDGERKIYTGQTPFSIRITKSGPVIIDIEKVMELAVNNRIFVE